MNNMILEFLEVYKSLDELCRQILSSDRGISDYIDEMNDEIQGYTKVACWKADYKQLKRMRWIRNQLVHEINSFEDELINAEDIEWLKDFRSRIMECTDPFSLLYQSRNTTKREDILESCSKTNKQLNNCKLVVGAIILTGIIIVIAICLVVFLFLCL